MVSDRDGQEVVRLEIRVRRVAGHREQAGLGWEKRHSRSEEAAKACQDVISINACCRDD